MKSHLDVYTLITGASAGLGKEMAIQCAKLKRNLILVALPGRNLKSVAEHIAELYQVKVAVFELDLTKDAQLNQLVNTIYENFRVDFCIHPKY